MQGENGASLLVQGCCLVWKIAPGLRAGLSCVASRNKETKLSLALLRRQVLQLPLVHGHREGKPLEQGVGWPEGR